MMKYVAIITYATNVQVGAIIKAKDRVSAWKKLIASLDGGDCVSSIKICEVLPDMEMKA